MKKIAYTITVIGFLSIPLALAQQTPQQQTTAVDQISIWLLGFHPMKDNPSKQFMAHHLCQQLRPDLMQCVLYDGNQPDSRMIGVEYIVPQETYQSLGGQEKQYWHPHNFEILSGELVAPGVPNDAELLASKMNSYGKTWHTWDAGLFDPETRSFTAEEFPTGEPHLAWSFNHLGEEHDGLLEAAFESYDINPAEKREQRAKYVGQAEPQCGVNAIVDEFEGPVESIPGVEPQTTGC